MIIELRQWCWGMNYFYIFENSLLLPTKKRWGLCHSFLRLIICPIDDQFYGSTCFVHLIMKNIWLASVIVKFKVCLLHWQYIGYNLACKQSPFTNTNLFKILIPEKEKKNLKIVIVYTKKIFFIENNFLKVKKINHTSNVNVLHTK